MPIAIKMIAALMLAGFVLVLLGMHIAALAVGALGLLIAILGAFFTGTKTGQDFGCRIDEKIMDRAIARCQVDEKGYCAQCHSTMYAGFDERCHPDVIRAKAALLRGEGKEKGE